MLKLNLEYLLYFILLLYGLAAGWNFAADPQFFITMGRIADQGSWLHEAKNVLFFHQLFIDNFSASIYTSPIFALATIISAYLVNQVELGGQLVSLGAFLVSIVIIYNFLPKFITQTQKFLICLIFMFHYLNWQYAKMANSEQLSALPLIFSMLLLLDREKLIDIDLKNKSFLPKIQSIFSNRFFLSGLFFGIAIITRSTLLQMVPAVGLIFLWHLYERKFSRPILFAFGASLPFFSIILFYEKMGILARTLEVLNCLNSVFKPESWQQIIGRLFEFLEKEYWGSIITFPLIIFPLIFLVYLLLKIFVGYKKSVSYELWVLYSWLIGGSVLYTVSNFQPISRLIFMVLPLAILNICFVHYLDFLQLQDEFLGKMNNRKSIFLRCLLNVPLALITLKILVFLSKKLGIFLITDSKIQFFIFILLLGLSTFFINRISKIHIKISFVSYLSFILIIPSLSAFILLKQWFDIAYLTISANYLIRQPLGIFFFLFLWGFLFFLLYKKPLISNLVKVFILLYFVINFIFIGNELFFPKYSLQQTRASMVNYVQLGETVGWGYWTSYFFIDHPVKVIRYFPKDIPFDGMLSDTEENAQKVDWYIQNVEEVPIAPEFVSQHFFIKKDYYVHQRPFSNLKGFHINLWQRKK